MSKDIFIVDGGRTPFLKAGAKPNPLSAADLAVSTAKPLLQRQPFAASELGEVILGCVGPSSAEANVARVVALRSGCGDSVPAWTVQRNCASGLQAIDCAAQDIASGRHELVMAGGSEAMSRTPLLWNEDMVNWLADLRSAKTFGKKFATILQLRPGFFVPVVALLQALTDPVVNLNMGQTAEKIAYIFGITRQQMDEFSLASHNRALAAQQANVFVDEIQPLFDWRGNLYDADNGVRAGSSIEKLATLKPVFDKPFGLVTAGNSSQISDGAALMLLASSKAVKKYGLQPLAKVVDVAWAGLDPSVMGLGPAYSIAKLLQQNKLRVQDIDYWEINEAFAAQVIACVQGLADQEFCQTKLGADAALGTIDYDRLNIDGGAIAIGHPVGASGARLTLHLAHILRRKNARYGVASLCIGGGQGGAVLLENVSGGA